VLARLLDPVVRSPRARDRGTAVLHLRLRLVTRDLHLHSLQLPSPMRDPKVLRTLLLLDLESHPAPAGIDAVTLSIDPTPSRIVQESLRCARCRRRTDFDPRRAPAGAHGEEEVRARRRRWTRIGQGVRHDSVQRLSDASREARH
jgi:hypothetical protein